MVDLLREKERIREEMLDEEVQTEDACRSIGVLAERRWWLWFSGI